MDFDVIIYVIIGIVWVVVSIIQANQKAKKKRAAQNSVKSNASQTRPNVFQNQTQTENNNIDTPNTGSNIENWLAELMGETKVTPQSQKIEAEPVNIIENSIQPDVLNEDYDDEKSTALKESFIGSSNFVSEQYENDVLSDFDLRKAVIYSEILNRPYN